MKKVAFLKLFVIFIACLLLFLTKWNSVHAQIPACCPTENNSPGDVLPEEGGGGYFMYDGSTWIYFPPDMGIVIDPNTGLPVGGSTCGGYSQYCCSQIYEGPFHSSLIRCVCTDGSPPIQGLFCGTVPVPQAPSCVVNGSRCPDVGSANVCCSGYCNTSSVCDANPIPTPKPTSPSGLNTISGTVYIDTNSNGFQDAGEVGYGNAYISAGINQAFTDNSGSYLISTSPGIYTVALTVPAGYTATTSNPAAVTTPPDSTLNFGIHAVLPPSCPGGLSANPTAIKPGSTSSVSVAGCTGVAPMPFTWPPITPQCSDGIDNDSDALVDRNDPGCHTDGDASNTSSYAPFDNSEASVSTTCTDSGITNIVNAPTSATATWNAPTCNRAQLVCPVTVTVKGTGSTVAYSQNISVDSSYSVTVNVREVGLTETSCNPTVGKPYEGARVQLVGKNISTNITTDANGQNHISCLPSGGYTATIGNISEYDVVGRSPNGGGFENTIATSVGPDQTVTFCVAQMNPWYQTDMGDVRFRDVNNPLPLGSYGSIDANYPGIYYSSSTISNLGNGGVSPRGWVVDDEYSFNANTKNKNGSLAYGFYKSKARQDGVTIAHLTAGSFDPSQITGSGIYEADGDLTVGEYKHIPGSHVLILVNGTTTISTPISIPVSQGFLIVASKGDLIIDRSIGTSDPINETTLSSTSTQLDGYYSSEKNIILDGSGCKMGADSDRRLNIGGAIIANAAKPLAVSVTGGRIINNRVLCNGNATHPTLYVATRTDFLTQLTDFYKTTYTKWQEVRP